MRTERRVGGAGQRVVWGREGMERPPKAKASSCFCPNQLAQGPGFACHGSATVCRGLSRQSGQRSGQAAACEPVATNRSS